VGFFCSVPYGASRHSATPVPDREDVGRRLPVLWPDVSVAEMKARASGCDDYWTKPYGPVDLLRTLWSYLDRDTGRIPVIEIGASSAGRPRGWSERSAADEGAVRRPGARLQPFDQVGERYGAEAMITDLMAIRRKDISARHFLGKSPRHVRVLAKLTQWKKG
jgi:hypothetical protein